MASMMKFNDEDASKPLRHLILTNEVQRSQLAGHGAKYSMAPIIRRFMRDLISNSMNLQI